MSDLKLLNSAYVSLNIYDTFERSFNETHMINWKNINELWFSQLSFPIDAQSQLLRASILTPLGRFNFLVLLQRMCIVMECCPIRFLKGTNPPQASGLYNGSVLPHENIFEDLACRPLSQLPYRACCLLTISPQPFSFSSMWINLLWPPSLPFPLGSVLLLPPEVCIFIRSLAIISISAVPGLWMPFSSALVPRLGPLRGHCNRASQPFNSCMCKGREAQMHNLRSAGYSPTSQAPV